MVKSSVLHTIPITTLMASSISSYKTMASFPSEKLSTYSLWKKLWNERRLKKLINTLLDDLEPYMPELKESIESGSDTRTPGLLEVKALLTDKLLEIEDKKLLFDQPFLKYFIEEGFLDVAESFMTRAKKEDANLTNEEIFQALRNVWIMNSLQLYWDIPLALTTPMYAYSMLYPYTDNLLDDPAIDPYQKQEFNDRLSRVLSGQSVLSSQSTERRIFSLVEQIKAIYPQDTYPEVTESIQLIHSAQIESLKQGIDQHLSEEEILNISFFKGGTSVLADAYLIKGNVSEEEMSFAFQFGAFLQLLDDLQDMKEDKKSHNQTLFSIKQSKAETDDEIRRLITYIYSVNNKKSSDSENTDLLKEVISQCTLIMIMEAVGKTPDSITPSLYKELEAYSKIRLKTYRTLEKKFEAFLNK